MSRYNQFMMTAPARRTLTEDEFMRLPQDGHKYELVDGELLTVTISLKHDQTTALSLAQLVPHVLQGRISLGQAGFRMRGGNIRVPDLSFTRRERLPGGQVPNTFGDAAPDLCVEIISPSEDAADMARKVEEYFDAGAQIVWHVFPDTQTVTVWRSPTDATALTANDMLSGDNLLPAFSCPVSELFALL